jgi:UrcA family protein
MSGRIFFRGAPLLAAALTASISPAAAGDDHRVSGGRTEQVTIRVNYSDLDLGKADDIAQLQRRVRAEAGRACREHEIGPVVLELRIRKCIREADRNACMAIARAKTRREAALLAARGD